MQDEQQPTSTAPAPAPTWQFTGNENSAPAPTAPPSSESVSWTASEFIAHAKSGGWYILLFLVVAALAVLCFLTTKHDKLSTAVVIIAGILFGVMAARQPRELPYKIDSHGIKIGEKNYVYANFKSFSLVQEEGMETIWLMPLQRYLPGLSIYFSPGDKNKILDILEDYLPVEHRKLDFVDKLMHKIRF